MPTTPGPADAASLHAALRAREEVSAQASESATALLALRQANAAAATRIAELEARLGLHAR